MLRIVTFVVIAILVYQPLFGGKWINHPAGGWDEGHTADSWDTYRWDWDWIDCTYFAMVTMTTVGYGDMPTLRQEMRIFTIFFGVLGVVFVASSITVIADFFSEQARKRFIARQRILLKDAHKAAELFLWKVLKALRPTGAYFGLCILLGEIENAQIEGCEGFGSGWACGFAGSCEGWKSQGSRDYCWSWIDELYFGVVTYMTIGFGDVSAHTKAGKLMGTFIVVMGVFCFTTLLAELNDIKQAKRLGAEKTLRQRLDELQEVIEQDDDGKVTPEEYIIFNLKKMGKIDDETLDLLRDQFKALDADGSGELDADDIAMLATAAKSMESDANATPGGAPASARGSLRR